MVASFFKECPEFFTGRIKRIVDYDDKDNMVVELKKFLESKPQSILDTIHKVFGSQICTQLDVDNWGFVDELVGEDGKLNMAVKERETDIFGLFPF